MECICNQMFEFTLIVVIWGISASKIIYLSVVSADMAHALHPNYSERHEDHHQPKLHEGLVIKHNASQRYATNAVTAFLFKEVAKARGIPTQVRYRRI